MATIKRPIKKAQSGKEINSFATAKGLPIPRHDLSGTNGAYATGVKISDKDFKKHRKDFEYLDTPKPKPMKKLTPKKPLMKTTPMKRTPMKKGGTISKAKTGKTVKKAFLGTLMKGLGGGLLGGGKGGGLLGGLLGGGALGGLLGGGGGGGAAGGAGGAGGIGKMFGGSMKKGGKVRKTRTAKTGTSLGMKSVKAGYDKNPRVTRADIITAATKKAQNGTAVTNPVKKQQNWKKEMDLKKKELYSKTSKPKAKSGGSVKKCKYGCK